MKIFRFIFILVCIINTASTYSWNYTGHVVIAQIAYNNLNPDKKNKADQLAKIIMNELPEEQKEKLNRYYPNASDFAKLAMMPDVWRKWKLATLFNKFNANIPLNLILYSNQNTASWHFVDACYPKNLYCMPYERKNAIWAINKIESDLASKNNEQTEALLMVLLEHYIGDIHQPLHTITNIATNPLGDRGGNDFCIKINKNGRCTKNLHSLWDSGVGYLKPRENIQEVAYDIQQNYPINKIPNQKENNSQRWANESYQYAPFIYRLEKNTGPSKDYYMNGQNIAKSQIALAGYRLARALNDSL